MNSEQLASFYDRKGNIAWGLALGIPINRQWGLKIAYIDSRTTKRTGSDSDTISNACSVPW